MDARTGTTTSPRALSHPTLTFTETSMTSSSKSGSASACPFSAPVVCANYVTGERVNHIIPPEAQGCPQGACFGAMNDHRRPSGDLDLEPHQVLQEATSFLNLYYRENNLSADVLATRLAAVEAEVLETGTYYQTYEELHYGCRVAWRNAARCIGRVQWHKLEVMDCRDPIKYSSNEAIFEGLKNHLKVATNGGRLQAAVSIFPQRIAGKRGPRLWNPQLVRYAGYKQADGSVIGDPANVNITNICLDLGWEGRGGQFDVLPLVIQADGQEPTLHELPKDAVLEVPITHPTHAWFGELGLRWHAVPALADFAITIGGIVYSCAPFNGWYMGAEIGARNFADVQRYNLLPTIGARLTQMPRVLLLCYRST